MSFNYAVLGAGRQGTAAAYDMGRWGDAERVLVADVDLSAAQAAARRVNALLEPDQRTDQRTARVTAHQLDVTNASQVVEFLADVDACLSAVPYYFNLAITKAAIAAGTSLCDLGGHVGIARQQHALDPDAKAAAVSVVPNCGQVPGMGTSLMVLAMELLDEPQEVFMWDGGLPVDPTPPFQYLLTFNVEGLTNEYAEPPVYIRDGKVVEAEPLAELETVEFPAPFGTLEAFTTGGGTDSMPWTYEGKLQTLVNKTLRYPGHYAQLRAYYDLGLWGKDPMRVKDTEVVPRDVFHALFEPKVTDPTARDAILVRVKATGLKDGRPAEALVEVIDYYDEETQFTAMERGTGWSAAIVAEMMARGETPRGAGGVEVMVPTRPYVEALAARGIRVTEFVKVDEA